MSEQEHTVILRAANTSKKLRNLGYALESAIADIIDNSISAGAHNIWIKTKNCQYIMISDDGEGMIDADIKDALDISKLNPDDPRDSCDLGRFGSGLKFASFSQCKKLILASKTSDGNCSAWSWDLDYVWEKDSWTMQRINISDYPVIQEAFSEIQHGSVILWEKLDKFVKDPLNISNEEKENFRDKLLSVIQYLGIIYHVFLSKGKLEIQLNNKVIKPIDPFLSEHNSIRIPLDLSNTPGLKIQPYILPQHSKLTEPEYNKAKGLFTDWNKAQGFYVYRNDRLICCGTWLGLDKYSKPRNTNLARIKLDITNTSDKLWDLDVMKTKVTIPSSGPYRDVLDYVAKKTCAEAEKVYSRKGVSYRKKQNPELQVVWDIKNDNNGSLQLKLNQNHPLIKDVLDNLPDDKSRNDVKRMFRLIEEKVPYHDILAIDGNNREIIPEPFENNLDECELLLEEYIQTHLKNMTMEERTRVLQKTEPFSDFPDLIKKHTKPEDIL